MNRWAFLKFRSFHDVEGVPCYTPPPHKQTVAPVLPPRIRVSTSTETEVSFLIFSDLFGPRAVQMDVEDWVANCCSLTLWIPPITVRENCGWKFPNRVVSNLALCNSERPRSLRLLLSLRVPFRPTPGSYPGPVQVPSRVRGGPVQIRHVLCFTVFWTHPGPEVGAIPAHPGPILLPSVPSRIGPGQAETDFLATSEQFLHGTALLRSFAPPFALFCWEGRKVPTKSLFEQEAPKN